MNGAIGTTTVDEIMTTVVLAVKENDKMEELAKIFDEQDINAAPVVDDKGTCIGIITSHDLVEFESKRRAVQNEMEHGSQYNLAHYGEGDQILWPGQYFDDVGFHMTRTVVTANEQFPVSRVARSMCKNHIHHVIVLNSSDHPIGMISTLDILGFILGEPVARKIHRSS